MGPDIVTSVSPDSAVAPPPPPVASKTPFVIDSPVPTLMPPNVPAEAVGRVYAVGIVGVFLVWKFGLRFFKMVTGK